MSNKITNISKAWNEQIESVLNTLDTLHKRHPLPSAQSHDFRITAYEGDVSAIDLETAILNDIAKNAHDKVEFGAKYIDSVYKSYDQIQNTYAQLDTHNKTNLKMRRQIALNSMSATNILIKQSQKPLPRNTEASVSSLKEEASKKSVKTYKMTASPDARHLINHFILTTAKNKLLEAQCMPMWEITTEMSQTNANINKACTSEYNIIKDLIDRIEQKSGLDKNSYDVTIGILNSAHQLYMYSAPARQEFLERQACLHLALGYLYPDHKPSNLFGANKPPSKMPSPSKKQNASNVVQFPSPNSDEPA